MKSSAPCADAVANPDGSDLNGFAVQSNTVDPDAILNLVRLAHAQSQKLAEQWIPVTKQELEQEREATNLKEEFPFRPEYAGLGADISQTGDSEKRNMGIGTMDTGQLEKLRQQMLGKKAGKQNSAGAKRQRHQYQEDSTSQKQKIQGHAVVEGDDEEDEEGGRTAAITSKRPRSQISKLQAASSEANGPKPASLSGLDTLNTGPAGKEDIDEHLDHDNKPDSSATNTIASESKQKRQASSFLDQILAERSKKKKKKRKKENV